MSITDELREWLNEYGCEYGSEKFIAGSFGSIGQDRLLAIADRIDAEHQKAEDEWKAKDGQTWLRGYAEFRAELMEGNETLASDLERCGWIRLPLDAEGEPLRVGDEIEYPNGARDTVRFATISPIGWAVNDRGWVPEVMRHHHPPTVKYVLEGFARAYDDIGGRPDEDELWEKLLAEYAQKLRLAEEDV